jgi:hypothetical protein
MLFCEPEDIQLGFDTVTVDSASAPSIMFLIDNSGSMTGERIPFKGRDELGSRFEVVSDMLDSIAQRFPNAEVGLTVFLAHLYFDKSSSDYFAEYFQTLPEVYDGNANQAYLPLLQLDKVYSGGKTGYQIIKDVLAVDTYSKNIDGVQADFVDLVYEPGYDVEGTNINIGMLAVQDAFSRTVNPLHSRYLIFFSDGEPSGTRQAGLEPEWFTSGESIPTTFTVFFTDSSVESAPPSLELLTENIQQNGYSLRNKLSELWTIETNYNVLMDLLMDQVVNVIFTMEAIVATGTVKNMVINGVEPETRTDSTFIYEKQFPLEPNITKINVDIVYEFTNQQTDKKTDTTYNVDIYVKRVSSPDVSLPSGITKNCWEQPSLDLLFSGTSLLDSSIDETMENLQIRLSPNGEEMPSASVEVSVSLETEVMNLALNSGNWEKSFERAFGTTAIDDDGIIQHRNEGEIFTVVWRNPDIPLDTVRIAVPFGIQRMLELTWAGYYDSDADGYIDSIYVKVEPDTVKDADLETFKKWITLPSERGFTVVEYKCVPGGLAIIVEQKRDIPPNTGIETYDVLKVAGGIIAHGGLVPAGETAIRDKVAPVLTGALLEVTDTADDRLIMQFSEEVGPVGAPEPFNFSTSDGVSYSVTLEEESYEGVRHLFEVISISSDVDQMYKGDSVWISETGNISDGESNVQNNPSNRRVLLAIKIPPITIAPFAANSPYSGESGSNPEEAEQIQKTIRWIRQVYNAAGVEFPDNSGPVIIAQAEGKTLKRLGALSGTISIFDVVKNVLVENHPMIYDQAGKKLLYMWNGRNRNGKLAASGTYVAIMKIVNSDEPGEQVLPVRIGIKR